MRRHTFPQLFHQITDSLSRAKLIEFQSTALIQQFMKFINILALLFILAYTVAAQKPDDILATATGHVFHFRDLPPETQKSAAEMPARIAKARTEILGQLLNQRVVELEAKSQNISSGKVILNEKTKVASPSEAEIRAVYAANKAAIGDRTLDETRKQVVAYLRSQPEQHLLVALFARLNIKYKVTKGKDINAALLSPNETVATVNGQPVTAKEFEEYAKTQLYDAHADLANAILGELNESIYNALLADEAKALQIDAGMLIAREITDKMKDFTDDERFTLEGAFRKRLFAKYAVKILYKETVPLVQNISVDDDPSQGAVTAPVTIVMFTDFQCSACSATHPVLKKVMAEYPGKIRFVVRDFPLESIHENAFRAALAAGAANAQGKFFEYTEILYKNQSALDGESLKKYAAQIGLNVRQFELDLNSEKTTAEIRKDIADGESYGINSTPTIYINGVSVRILSADGFRKAIDHALKKSPS